MKRKTIIGIIAILFMAGVCLFLMHYNRSIEEVFVEENIEALTQVELWPNSCFMGVLEASWGEPCALYVRRCYGCVYMWALTAEYPGNC